MTALTIRDVSEDAVRTMTIRAAQADQSLQAYLRSLIEREASRPTVAEAVEQARRQATADISTDDILAAIDEGRTTVIDCSAMIELLAAKTQTGDAVARRVTAAQTLYAPYVLDGEVISALLGLIRGKKISEREADAALSNYRAFPVERQDVLPLWPRLKSLHANLSAYDAQYVALAEAIHVPLITADARVKRSGVARCEIEVFSVHT
jgi:predicted nucleic acid-binding protein